MASAIAEHSDLALLLPNPKVAEKAADGAGRFRVVRAEIISVNRRGLSATFSARQIFGSFRRTAAYFGAILHVTDAVAVVGALFANFSTCHTYGPINWRTDKEDVSTSTTHLCTGHNQAIVLGFNMLATQFETVMHRSAEANLIAAKTRSDNAAHCVGLTSSLTSIGRTRAQDEFVIIAFGAFACVDLDQAPRTLGTTPEVKPPIRLGT